MRKATPIKTIATLAMIILCLAGMSAYAKHWHHQHHLAPGMRGHYTQGMLSINGTRFHYWLADGKAQQAKGLLGVNSLEDQDGMLFVYTKPVNTPFHMHGMKIPLDFVWIRDGKIVALRSHVAPQPKHSKQLVISPQTFDRVLELKAGSIAKYQLSTGDAVH